MKKLLTIITLLCVSVVGSAIDWSSYAYLGDGVGGGAYNNKYKVAPAEGQSVVNIQQPGWASEPGIYTRDLGGAISSCSLGDKCAIDGGGIVLYLSAFIAQETEVTVVAAQGSKTFTVYYADGEPEDLTGFNLAKGKSSFAGKYPSGFEPAKANDGIIDNQRWASGSEAKHYAAVGEAAEDWWCVDLGGFYEIQEVKILFERANPSDYDILISNNSSSWTVIGTYTEESKFGNTDYNVYNFTDKVGRYVKIFARNGYASLAYGFSMYEFEVYGERATLDDHNPPTITSASLSGDPEWNQVNIAVSGTDPEDGAVTSFHVTDATHGVDQSCVATNGIITVTDLSGETSYSFTVKAVDAAGNESTNSVVVNATTPQDTSVPLVGAPTPSGTNKDVVHIYSDAFPSTDGYSSCLAHDFKKDGFGGVALMQEKNINGDKCLIYDIHGAAEVTCGHWDGGINAIIAADGYHHVSYTGIDASEMEYLHIDIWSLQACSNINIQINDVSLNTKRSHNGNGWNSFDIPLTDYTFGDGEHTRISNVRFMKINGLNSITGKMALDNIYFWKTASGMKSVSASVNNVEMGTATVKQNSVSVTEVTAGSEVTFSAVANDGYIFVNWSNGETSATFNATVDANMNLTANFRALGHISCNEELTNGDYTVYVTYRKTANENEYEFIVRSAQTMTGFSNAYIGRINGNSQVNLNGQGSLTGNGHKLSYTFTSTTEPKLNTPLYVNFANHGEVTFNQINNGTTFEFSQACADPEITAIALDKSEATLDMGNTLTLIPSFTPAYMSADITWQTSNDAVATVSNGVVTPVAPGNVTITAKVSESIKATCAVTVQTSQSHYWYGYGTDQDLDYTYRIEYTTDHHIVAHVKRQGDKVGLVDIGMNINNNWTPINVTDGEETGWKKGTTTQTYTAGDNLTIILQSNFYGASSSINISYTVGADNVMPTIEPSVLKLSNSSISLSLEDADVQLSTEIHHRDAANQTLTWTSDNENVVTAVGGLLHPVGVGTTTVHATTFNGIEATCTVTIVDVLEDATWYGTGRITQDGKIIGANYSITRTSQRKIRYFVSLSESVSGLADISVVIDGDWHPMAKDVSGRTAEWTTAATFSDGEKINFFFYLPFAGGDARWDIEYTVGSSNEEPNVLLGLNDPQANSTKIAENNQSAVDILFTRRFATPNEWYTICLPFSLSNEQLINVFGVGYQLAEMVGADDRGSLIYLNFEYVQSLVAGKAYMLRPTKVVTETLSFENVTIECTTPIVSGNDFMHFQGTYDQITLNSDKQRFVGSNNYLYSPAVGGTVMNAFRCYFEIPESSPAPGRPAKVMLGSAVATDVNSIEANDSESNLPIKIIRDGVLYIERDGHTFNAQGWIVK